MKYILYQKADGRIVGHGNVQEKNAHTLETDEIGALLTSTEPDPSLKVVNGELVPVEDGDFAEELLEEAWSRLRVKRHGYLAASDWTQVPDAPVDKQAWATYRQALRDLPQNTTDPREVVWPTPPQ